MKMGLDCSDIKTKTEELIVQFKSSPTQVISSLLLMQEICLQSNVLPNANVLDLSEDIVTSIEQLELSD